MVIGRRRPSVGVRATLRRGLKRDALSPPEKEYASDEDPRTGSGDKRVDRRGNAAQIMSMLRKEMPALVARQVAAELAKQTPKRKAPLPPPSPDRTPSPSRRWRKTARTLFSPEGGVPIKDGRVDRSDVLSAPRPRRLKRSRKQPEFDDTDLDEDTRGQRGPEPPKPKVWTGQQEVGESQRDFVARLGSFTDGLEEYLLWVRENYPKYDSGAEIAKYARHFLQGDAKILVDNVYVRAEEEAQGTGTSATVTWPMLKKALHDAAGPEATFYSAARDMEEMKQDVTETVQHFTARFTLGIRRLMAKGAVGAGLAARYYMQGLRPRISSTISKEIDYSVGWFDKQGIDEKHPFKAIDVLSTMATAVEKASHELRQDLGRADDDVRRHQDGAPRGGNGERRGANRPRRQGRGHFELAPEIISERANANRCFKCAQSGHRSSQCPNPVNRRAGLPRSNAITARNRGVGNSETEDSEHEHEREHGQGKGSAQ